MSGHDRHIPFILAVIANITVHSSAYADKEAGNQPYVRASEFGQLYAKCIPSETYGGKGTCNVFLVHSGNDERLRSYPWYSTNIFIDGFSGDKSVYAVNIGPWTRGHKANSLDLALAIYKNEKLLRSYSTLDIAGAPENVQASVSHYTVFVPVGFRRPFGNQLVFDIKLHEGKIVSFDAETGNVLTKENELEKQAIYEAENSFRQLRWQWYEQNKGKISKAETVPITEEMLLTVKPDPLPSLPKGYRYHADTVWGKDVVEKGER